MGGRAVWRIGGWFAIPAVLSVYRPILLSAQSPHAANPERPTVATHAYTVAPGYVELEQGVRAQGLGNFRDQTSWEFNLKSGVARPRQLGLFGTGYNRTGQGNGVGDVGVALKLRRDLSSTHAVALAPAVTLPTGDSRSGWARAGCWGASLPCGASSWEACSTPISTPARWASEPGGRRRWGRRVSAGPGGAGASPPRSTVTRAAARERGRAGCSAP